jgi:hypothetical protein
MRCSPLSAVRFLLALLFLTPCAFAWGPMHAAITEAAYDSLPPWQREFLANQRQTLIEFDCIIPDLARAPAHKKTVGRFVLLPNGDTFTHEPHSREHNSALMLHYFSKAVESVRAGELDEASRYAGCLLHFLEDCGSPAHSMPGDNQHGYMQDLLEVPAEFKDRPLHGLIEGGTLQLDLAGYRPQLLGTTPEEAVLHLTERLHAEIRNARAQVIPILQGVFLNDQTAIDTGRRRAATMDAQVAADALYSILAIAQNRFEPDEKVTLDTVDVAALTPLEVVSSSYFPQFSYFSNPYFGFPVRNFILEGGVTKQPLTLQIAADGATKIQAFERGLGLGTGCRVTYTLPLKVYERFECLVGLHATLGSSGAMSFRVFADGEAVFDSGILTGDTPAKKVSIPVWRVRQISIETQNRNTTATPGKNYAVIAEPRLIKAQSPPKIDQDKTP